MPIRRVAHSVDAIHRRLAGFGLDECTCFDEDDRALVYHYIAHLMRATRVVDAIATDSDAREAFNRLVRERLPGALTGSIGHSGGCECPPGIALGLCHKNCTSGSATGAA